MIQPTPGRVVWFRPSSADTTLFPLPALFGHPPMAAHVAAVHTNRNVNLLVIDPTGHTHPRGNVLLLQEGDERPTDGPFCEWMPYQKGQAAKAEQLEKQLKPGSA